MIFSFSKRMLALISFKIFCLLILVIRLYELQVKQKEHYVQLSNNNRLSSVAFQGPRGTIVDRTGEILATHFTSYKLLVHPAEKAPETLQRLSTILEINHPTKTSLGLLIKEDLSWKELCKLHIFDLPHLVIQSSETRLYKMPELFSHMMGYTGRYTDKDLEKNPKLSAVPDQRIGKLGVEKFYDEDLSGQPGVRYFEVNATHKLLKFIYEKPPVIGRTLKMTVHAGLQRFANNCFLDHPRGCCVVMNHHTGEILAYISKPGYDVNVFNKSIPQSFYKDLLSNADTPLINRPIQALYPPASLLKMLVALAALKQGIVDPENRIFCPGHIDIPGRRAYCWKWKHGGHGTVDLIEAIQKSCDVYFYSLALKLNPKILAEVCRDFGLGMQTGVDLPGEKSGLVPDPSWKKKRFKKRFEKNWTLGDTLNMSIGQGYMLCTPLQLVTMTATIANNGKKISPYFVRPAHPKNQTLKYTKEHLDIIREGMRCVVNEEGGTAYKSRPSTLHVSGKTGSAQVARITQLQRDNRTVNDLSYELKDHAYFTGFTENFSIIVMVEHGEWGGAVAAPLAMRILEKTHELIASNHKKTQMALPAKEPL